jgi:Ca2+-binding EF-hand superfamily protein
VQAALPAAREPGWLASLLKPFALPARTAHERAFGTLGAAGPSWLLLSQKVVLFNAIVSIVVGLDLASSADGAGGSAFADPVLAACLIPAVMAIALASATFLVFNWVTAVEVRPSASSTPNDRASLRSSSCICCADERLRARLPQGLKDMPALREVLSAQRKTTFDASITTLANLCDCFRVCSADGCFIPPETDVAIRPWPTLRDEFADNPDPLANLMLVFDEADANSDGWISCTELGRLARILGFELDRSQLQSFYVQARSAACPEAATAHTDARAHVPPPQAMELQGGGAVEAAGADGGDGEQLLDFAAFASVVLNQPRARGEREDAAPDEVICRAVFSFFDRSQNGILTVHEMTTSLERLGFDTAGTEQLFRDVAGAPQDTVSYEQFAWYCTEAGL